MRGTPGARQHREGRSSFSSWRLLRTIVLLTATACSDMELLEASGRLDVSPAVDFGTVAMGRGRTQHLTLKNLGRAPIGLQSMGIDLPTSGDFLLAPLPFSTLDAGQSAEIEIAFSPLTEGERAVRVRITTDSARTPEAVVDVTGQGVRGEAELPVRVLDFGRVAVQTSSELELPLHNVAANDAEVSSDAPIGDDADSFVADPTGELTVPPASTAMVHVRFMPIRQGPHEARLPIRPCPTCDVVEIALRGEGIAATLSASPPSIDFGMTEPKRPHDEATTVANEGSATVRILEVRLGGETPGEFTLQPLATPPPFDLAGGARFVATVRFTPAGYDQRSGTLRVRYADPSWTTPQEIVIPLAGSGGGPDIDVVPLPLSYPRTAVGLNVEKRLAVRNVGRDPTRPLIVTGLQIQGSVEFSLVNPPALPWTIAPGGQVATNVAFHPMAGGRSEARIIVTSNDPDESPLEVPLNGSSSALGPCVYEVVPTQLDFGSVAIGQQARLGVVVRNKGTETCAVANVRLSGKTDPSFAVTPLSTRLIDPGERLLIPVEYAAQSGRTATGELLFDVSSPTAPQVTVTLIARGLDPCLSVVPDHLDFGAVGLACDPPTLSVSVRNGCSQPVAVNQCSVGTGASTAFVVDTVTAAPRTLQAAQEMLVPVTYQPTEEGEDLAPLFIATDLSPTPLLVPLEGQARLRPTTTDEYVIPPRNQVDFLFIIDNSGSFTEEQNALSRNFDAFIRTATSNGTDYRVAVTTTGLTSYRGGWADCPGGVYGGEAGRFFPVDRSRARILTPQTPDVRGVFEQNVKVGICHWWEEGLEASRLALSTPLIDHDDDPATPEPLDGNSGFLRDEASLYVLYVSDEDDSGRTDPAEYVRFLLGLKPGRPDRVHASAIIGLPSCATAPSVGTRYMQVVNALGGVIADVCSPDWNGLMSRIGQDAFAPQTTFPLSEAPDGRDITVSVDGVDVPAVDAGGVRSWRYDSTIGANGAVVFEEAKAPGPGSTVELTYPVPCPARP